MFCFFFCFLYEMCLFSSAILICFSPTLLLYLPVLLFFCPFPNLLSSALQFFCLSVIPVDIYSPFSVPDNTTCNLILTLCLQELAADNFCKPFGPSSGPMFSGSQLFDSSIGFLKNFLNKVLKHVSRIPTCRVKGKIHTFFQMHLFFSNAFIIEFTVWQE